MTQNLEKFGTCYVGEWLTNYPTSERCAKAIRLWIFRIISDETLFEISKTVDGGVSENIADVQSVIEALVTELHPLGVWVNAENQIQRPLVYSFEVLTNELRGLAEFGGCSAESLVWNFKEVPDNSEVSHVVGKPGVYEIDWLEESGFVQIGNWLYSRTAQSCSMGVKTGVRVAEPTHLLIPEYMGRAFTEYFQTTPAIGGGIGFTGQYSPFPLDADFATRYGIHADVNVVQIIHSSYINDDWVPSTSLPTSDGIDGDMFATVFVDPQPSDDITTAN